MFKVPRYLQYISCILLNNRVVVERFITCYRDLRPSTIRPSVNISSTRRRYILKFNPTILIIQINYYWAFTVYYTYSIAIISYLSIVPYYRSGLTIASLFPLITLSILWGTRDPRTYTQIICLLELNNDSEVSLTKSLINNIPPYIILLYT